MDRRFYDAAENVIYTLISPAGQGAMAFDKYGYLTSASNSGEAYGADTIVFKAIPHNCGARIAPSDFSADETKAADAADILALLSHK